MGVWHKYDGINDMSAKDKAVGKGSSKPDSAPDKKPGKA